MANGTSWSDGVEEILSGDQAMVLAHLTPARGVILTPVTNFALQDRLAGTVTFNSSVGMWRKLERIRLAPKVALVFHTRAHSRSDRRDYLLVQGRASLPSLADPDAWLEAMGANWERFGGQPRNVGRRWERWLSAYHWRVNVEVAVERVLAWPDLACSGPPTIHGSSPPAQPPPPQRPPARGRGPRIDHARAAARAARLPSPLLGWVGADGFPVVVPVELGRVVEDGISLRAPRGLLPQGGRRAGLLAHWFSRYVLGQRQRKHTGWLDVGAAPDCLLYAPHTESGYYLPRSRLAFNLSAGFITQRGLRQARSQGLLAE